MKLEEIVVLSAGFGALAYIATTLHARWKFDRELRRDNFPDETGIVRAVKLLEKKQLYDEGNEYDQNVKSEIFKILGESLDIITTALKLPVMTFRNIKYLYNGNRPNFVMITIMPENAQEDLVSIQMFYDQGTKSDIIEVPASQRSFVRTAIEYLKSKSYPIGVLD